MSSQARFVRWFFILLFILVILYSLFQQQEITPSTTPAGLEPITAYFTHNLESISVSSSPSSMDATPLEAVLLRQIENATDSIAAAFYDFNRISVLDALIAAHRRGVDVQVVTDDETRYFVESYVANFEALEGAGIPLRDDGREQSIMHNKYFIFDEQLVWSGSTNISDNGFTANHNNAVLLASTQLATLYQRDFSQMWRGDFSVAKLASDTHRLEVAGAPVQVFFSPKDAAIQAIIDQIDAATTSIDFAIFFFTHPDLRAALLRALARGIQIRGLWDSLGSASPFSQHEELCEAGIPIKIEDTSGKMHNKYMVIDYVTGDDIAGAIGADNERRAPRVITGSMNWTSSGDESNDENTLIIQDATVALGYAENFDAMWNALAPATQCATGEDTPSLTTGNIRVIWIVYNPDGDDVEGERVILRNDGDSPQNLHNWTLSDASGATYQFPAVTLEPNRTLTLWTKPGRDSSTSLYWGRQSPVWNNGGDSVLLQSEIGVMVDSCSYPGGDIEEECIQ